MEKKALGLAAFTWPKSTETASPDELPAAIAGDMPAARWKRGGGEVVASTMKVSRSD